MDPPRKRKPTAKVLENADPLLQAKRQKTTSTVAAAKTSIAESQSVPSVPSIAAPSATQSALKPHVDDSTHSPDTDVSESDNDHHDTVETIDHVEIIDPVKKAKEELQNLIKKWNAPIYAFFNATPQIEVKNGMTVHVFECIAEHCKGKGKNQRQVRRNTGTSDATSTSNLHKHAVLCWGKETVDAACRAKSVHDTRAVMEKAQETTMRDGSLVSAFERMGRGKETYSSKAPTKMEVRAYHVRWMAESKRPFNIVNDPGLRRLMKVGRPSYPIPSGWTVSNDVQVVFRQARRQVMHLLQSLPGNLSFAFDAWTSPNSRSLMAITVHYEAKGQVSSWLLDIVEVARSHTGSTLAESFGEAIESLGIDKKVLCITCDNASSNDTMIRKLEERWPDYPGEAARTRCFAHILNLVVKSILAQFDIPESDQFDNEGDEEEGAPSLRQLAANIDEEEAQEVDEERKAVHDADNDDGWVDEREGMSGQEVDDLECDVVPARRVLTKLRKIAYSVKNSSTKLLPRWYEICTTHGFKKRVMPRDVKTRWNSTYDMVEFALEYQPVIDQLTAERGSNLRNYELQTREWAIVIELKESLRIFKDGTLYFSREDAPNLAMVIPAMDLIYDTLKTKIDSHTLSPAVAAALRVGRRTLNRYYTKTDYSETYRIAMVLHPCRKLTYFRGLKWPEPWIKDAETLVRTNYELRYKHIGESKKGNRSDVNAGGITRSQSLNMFDNLPFLLNDNTVVVDEVTKYLEAAAVIDVDVGLNPLAWWLENRHTFPGLSRMARDYLSIPPTSVDVERIFSGGRMLLSYLRNRMEVRSIRALLCLGEWIKKGVIKDKDIVAALNGVPEKHKESDVEEEETSDEYL